MKLTKSQKQDEAKRALLFAISLPSTRYETLCTTAVNSVQAVKLN